MRELGGDGKINPTAAGGGKRASGTNTKMFPRRLERLLENPRNQGDVGLGMVRRDGARAAEID